MIQLKLLKIYVELIFTFQLNKLTTNNKITVTGHRGAGGLAPENTLASIQLALDLGVDRIEIDV